MRRFVFQKQSIARSCVWCMRDIGVSGEGAGSDTHSFLQQRNLPRYLSIAHNLAQLTVSSQSSKFHCNSIVCFIEWYHYPKHTIGRIAEESYAFKMLLWIKSTLATTLERGYGDEWGNLPSCHMFRSIVVPVDVPCCAGHMGVLVIHLTNSPIR